jgi:hypothetical protein
MYVCKLLSESTIFYRFGEDAVEQKTKVPIKVPVIKQ